MSHLLYVKRASRHAAKNNRTQLDQESLLLALTNL